MFYAGVIFYMKMKMKKRNETTKKKWSGHLLWWWVKVILFKVDIFSYFLFRLTEFEYIMCQNWINSVVCATCNALSVCDEYWSSLYCGMMENIPFLCLYFLAYRFFHNKVLFNANASVCIRNSKNIYFLLIMWAFLRMAKQKIPRYIFL